MHFSQVTGSGPVTQTVSPSPPGPGAARMVLGARLRKLREAEYISQEEAADAMRTTQARLNLLELGRSSCRLRDVTDLLTIYCVTDETERRTLMALAGQANVPGWWHAFEDVVPDWLQTYLGLEQSAGVIRGYEVQFVPGLLQTRDYARAVIALGHGDAPEVELRRRVELRMFRQQILHGPRPPHLWSVIDEAALRRPIGGAGTMRRQLHHLITMCELPHVTVQVLPFAAGGHAAAGGPVTLLRLPEQGLPDVVYLEQLRGAHYPEEADDIEHYRQVIDGLVTRAQPAARTREILHALLEESESENENTDGSTDGSTHGSTRGSAGDGEGADEGAEPVTP